MIGFTPDVFERDFTPIGAVWQAKMNAKLVVELMKTKQGIFFTFDNGSRLLLYRRQNPMGYTFEVVYFLPPIKSSNSYLIHNEQPFNENEFDNAVETFIKRLNANDPALILVL